jgi:hypothetical protein
VNAPILADDDLAVEHTVAGVWNFCITLCCIASCTRIEKVIVVESSLGLVDLSSEMVEMIGCFQDTPLFSFQTVNAAKYEFVTKPWAITLVIRIASWAVAAHVW